MHFLQKAVQGYCKYWGGGEGEGGGATFILWCFLANMVVMGGLECLG